MASLLLTFSRNFYISVSFIGLKTMLSEKGFLVSVLAKIRELYVGLRCLSWVSSWPIISLCLNELV